MQQHERPAGCRPAPVHPSRLDRVPVGAASAADGSHAPRAGFDGVAFSVSGSHVSGRKDAGRLVVLHGTKITATGSRTVSPGDSGAATGCPDFGAATAG